MDTNVKKFKFSLPCKILCVVLCIVTFASAFVCGFLSFASTIYVMENEDCESWTDTLEFYNFAYFDVVDVINTATYNSRITEVEKIVEGKRESVLDKFEKDYIDEWNRQSSEDVDYIDMYSFLDRNLPINLAVNSHGFWSVNFNPNIPQNTLPHEIRNVLEKAYDNKTNFSYYQGDLNLLRNNTGFLCYIEYDGKTYGDKTVPDKLTSTEVSYSLEGGQVISKGISTAMQTSISEHLSQIGVDENKITIKFCLELEKPDTLLNTVWRIENKYLQLKEFHTLAEQVYASVGVYIIATIVLLVVSFICGITFLKATGRNGERGRARLSFIDYMPIELHFALGVALGFGAFFLTTRLIDYIDIYSVTAVWAVTALASLAQMLLLEFSASVSRAIGSERANKKFFLLFWLIVGLIEIFKLIGRVFKKIARKIKQIFKPFTYKAKHFDKLFLAKIGLVYLVNIAILLVALYCVAEWWLSPGGIVLFIIVAVVANFFMVKKAVAYVKDLDKIIVASDERREPDLDIDKLHISLKTLAENMRYSNAELQTAITKAVKDERLRAELITNVSHDLKTPLTSIISYVDLLSKCDINDPKALEYIKVLDEKGAKLKRLIDDLIEASKVTSGNISLDITPLNLSELCLQSTTEAIRDFEKNSLELIVKQGEKPTQVLADGAKTYRVIENLLSNARKYSARHSRVYVSVYEEYGRGVFEIKNISANPLDITPDELTERFVRGDQSRNTDGNGLGLSIAKELCKAQNGELELTIDGDLFKARVLLPRG